MDESHDPIVRKTVSLPASLWARIEDFQFQHRVKRDAEAIRRLVERGLRPEPPAVAPAPSDRVLSLPAALAAFYADVGELQDPDYMVAQETLDAMRVLEMEINDPHLVRIFGGGEYIQAVRDWAAAREAWKRRRRDKGEEPTAPKPPAE